MFKTSELHTVQYLVCRDADPNSDPAFYFNADSDPDFYFNAFLDPTPR